jgi:hypothetical protein
VTSQDPPAPSDVEPPPEPLPKFTIVGWLHDYFLGEDPTVGVAMVPLCLLSMVLYTRDPRTNFIFDEQEALLANPYVRSIADASPKFHWLDAFHRDFWGLAPDRTIGSYRPIPDLIWRLLWWLHARDTPFLHHWVNVMLHGLNGALVTFLVLKWTKRRGMAWIAGALFVGSAVITEAVSGVVGVADVLGGLGVLLALLALTLPMWAMPLGVFAAALLGLFSKESALCVVPLRPLRAAPSQVVPGHDADRAHDRSERRQAVPPADVCDAPPLVRAAGPPARSAEQSAHQSDAASTRRRGAARVLAGAHAGGFPDAPLGRLLVAARAAPLAP